MFVILRVHQCLIEELDDNIGDVSLTVFVRCCDTCRSICLSVRYGGDAVEHRNLLKQTQNTTNARSAFKYCQKK